MGGDAGYEAQATLFAPVITRKQEFVTLSLVEGQEQRHKFLFGYMLCSRYNILDNSVPLMALLMTRVMSEQLHGGCVCNHQRIIGEGHARHARDSQSDWTEDWMFRRHREVSR